MKRSQHILLRVARRFATPLRIAASASLAPCERAFLRSAGRPPFPPLFIVGAPRVGSTLLYQALVRGLNAAYFCNAAAAVPKCPAIITAMLAAAHGVCPPEDFSSHYGSTAGWNAPAQGREIWGRWFPPDQAYVGPGRVTPSAILEMQQTVARVEQSCGSPFVSKSQGHAVRIRPLFEAFPDAVFVRISRDRHDVEASILRGRRECLGDERVWFSAKPSNYDTLCKKPPLAQIAGQIQGIEKDMDRDFAATSPDRGIGIRYEAFCESPRDHLQRIAAFYFDQTGIALEPRYDVPESFRIASRPSGRSY